eukprot:CAMPEP_0194490384 /NCGR_PEP_ID=MMETSP0253-20130528/9622_1 /TAXON_ID=2966 /ORGANISM="Noctiluca scintillans" /LENGTH=176 /DNA_ID=CAMNT_0039331003 /DNA_START=28 /DNA_END=558 /DNA_ORIENTATION=-
MTWFQCACCCADEEMEQQTMVQVPARKLFLDGSEDKTKKGPGQADNEDSRSAWLNRLENQDKDRPQQRVETIINQVEHNYRHISDTTPDFNAELSLDDNKQIGIDIKVDPQQYVLKVGALKEVGSVVSWNRANPDKMIEVGDLIIMVNGETEMEKMLKQKSKDKKFVMAIKKVVRE